MSILAVAAGPPVRRSVGEHSTFELRPKIFTKVAPNDPPTISESAERVSKPSRVGSGDGARPAAEAEAAADGADSRPERCFEPVFSNFQKLFRSARSPSSPLQAPKMRTSKCENRRRDALPRTRSAFEVRLASRPYHQFCESMIRPRPAGARLGQTSLNNRYFRASYLPEPPAAAEQAN